MTNELIDQIAAFDRLVLGPDRDLIERILHPEFALVLVVPEPAVVPRERWLEMLPDYLVHSWEVQEQYVDNAGQTAAALRTVRMEATGLGEDRSGVFVISDIWLASSGGWQIWRRHSTPLTAGRMPGMASSA